MKSFATLVFISLLTISCRSKQADENLPEIQVGPTETESLVLQMQGTYDVCMVSPDYPTYYAKVHVTVVGNVYSIKKTLSTAADCSNPYYEFITTAEISSASTITNTPLNVKVDLKIRSYTFKDLDGWYSSQNYCGMTDWVAGVAKDVTGQDCPGLNSSDFGSIYLSVNDIDYESMVIGSSSLDVVVQENESGIDEANRKVTGLANIPKI